MKKLNASIIKFAVVLQLFILLFAAVSVSAASPQLPIIAGGEVELDEKSAEAGTTITVMLDGKVVSKTTVSNDGIYGDKPSNRLLITESDYTKYKFYVNGIESELANPDAIKNAKSGDLIELNLKATTPTESSGDDVVSTSMGGGGGMAAPSAPSDDGSGAVDESPSVPSDETVLPSPGSEIDTGSDESMPVPTPESQSTLVFGLVLLLFVVLVGIGALKYKKK
ncbi:hypothetical protein Mzhil_0291 [Methanosalsum zhilinae DSM 4017]|uniref:Uncharacterized protein n=1 Tax=Methanosalsum zhilinae (strain DSM 4017 / NBRC 107636 / OCM 62 / WeN5) TaxID=679901 RepID=F7XNX7_METZD|nr:hypothetical protein [Methanosalsum zhilinae]AEH60167.1 hypothetical protein Mzhil_0291 [Methanosalsum zhilinae DSM 4017]